MGVYPGTSRLWSLSFEHHITLLLESTVFLSCIREMFLKEKGIQPFTKSWLSTVVAQASIAKYHPQWLKQQTFISHSFGDWKLQDQGASRFSSWWIQFLAPLCAHTAFPWWMHMERERNLSLLSSSYQDTRPQMRAPPSWPCPNPISSQRPHLQISSYCRLGLHDVCCGVEVGGDTQTFSP